MKTADQKDIDNVEAWAEVVQGIMWHVPLDRRSEVLAIAVKKEEADRQEREALGVGFKLLSFDELSDMNRPGMRHRSAIMRLKSLIVQVFVRSITNNHSRVEAAALLFSRQRFGTGSGELSDYIGDLMERAR